MNNTYFYQDKPVFGLDIGFSSLKVMQIDNTGKLPVVLGYGVTNFDSSATEDGIIVKPEVIAQAALELFRKNLIGEISTKRVVIALPAARTFSRTMTLPKLNQKDLTEAVRLEAEQYIPLPIDDLYLDYEVVRTQKDENDILMVAIPKKIVDPYIILTRMLGLEAVVFETTISSGGRLFEQAEQTDSPTVLIDLGTLSSDITIYDKGLIVSGTIPNGGDDFSNIISETLNVTKQEANIIKTKYGLGVSKKQKEITTAMTPVLNQIVKEIRRMIRYYEERSGSDQKIGQIVTIGGGANMPGLSEFLTSTMRLPVRMCDPWQHLDFAGLQPPNINEKSMYITVAGLALIDGRKVFA
jgi:type IV pilus assembly protein PilM